eukprot:TRINITY_DN103043_c0_g1_i1.p2 TRINITY_DN103043_c0_g1~~TRINITY_DN103043_c0_g1_i1.p2  ORF type:complete len:185 (-),score=34.63 TRINITY_DN103043_c0_g1_i1:289-843(-)
MVFTPDNTTVYKRHNLPEDLKAAKVLQFAHAGRNLFTSTAIDAKKSLFLFHSFTFLKIKREKELDTEFFCVDFTPGYRETYYLIPQDMLKKHEQFLEWEEPKLQTRTVADLPKPFGLYFHGGLNNSHQYARRVRRFLRGEGTTPKNLVDLVADTLTPSSHQISAPVPTAIPLEEAGDLQKYSCS